jgi:hypothetical protein
MNRPSSQYLTSWRDRPSKRALIAFVERVTRGPGAVPVSHRIAAFDNDGTLCCEKPHTAFAAFLADRPKPGTGAAGPAGQAAVADGHRVLALAAQEFAASLTTRQRAASS